MKEKQKYRKEISICNECNKEYHAMFTSKGLFCSRDCSGINRAKETYNKYLEDQEKYNSQSNMSWIKPHIIKEQENKCVICLNKPIWNNKPLVLILDHINGDSNNNTRNNLRCICSNCDSQLDTFKRRNKVSSRTNRYKIKES